MPDAEDQSDQELDDDQPYTNDDKRKLGAVNAAASAAMLSLIRAAAQRATQKMLLSANGNTDFGDLLDDFGQTMDGVVARVATAGDMSIMAQFRTMLEQGFGKIAQADGIDEPEFAYEGPEDDLNRPFCADMMAADDTYTREEIDGLDNDDLGDPWTDCGGPNCRHIWIEATPKSKEQGGAQEDEQEAEVA